MWADYIPAHRDRPPVHSFPVFPIRRIQHHTALGPRFLLSSSNHRHRHTEASSRSPSLGKSGAFQKRGSKEGDRWSPSKLSSILEGPLFVLSRSMRAIYLLLLGVVAVSAQRRLALPDPRSCANRVRHATYRDGRGVAHSYFFSWEHAPTRNLEVDWLDARNICRRHCMDAVSLETPQENEFVKQRLARGNVRYIWTSGRKCNFNGCDRPDLQPQNINGWFWSGSGAKIGPTSQRNSGDWSNTGGFGQPQPDNREAAQGNDESCLSILNNFYNDGIKWHDVACHHVKPFVCEDSDELLTFVASRNPGIRL
ncbi:uncharacterized protein [Linepithema humile]|uniref:uncharacterized protein n=1 Tax=Linepithema humile TaxID=83485 RepID=UPI0006230CA6|nr:PREDICTED: uncharacterized protein LOC105674405 isoform X1 [Linepithema humile]